MPDDLFHDDDTVNEQALEDLTPIRLEAAIAVLAADHEAAIAAHRAGEPNDLRVLSRRLHNLRSLLRSLGVLAGQRTADLSATTSMGA